MIRTTEVLAFFYSCADPENFPGGVFRISMFSGGSEAYIR